LGEIIPHTPGIAMDASVVFRSLIRALRARCRSSSPKRAGGYTPGYTPPGISHMKTKGPWNMHFINARFKRTYLGGINTVSARAAVPKKKR